jgi:hypothetical protein
VFFGTVFLQEELYGTTSEKKEKKLGGLKLAAGKEGHKLAF